MAVKTTKTQASVANPARLGNDELELLVMEFEEAKAKARQLYERCDQIESALIASLGLQGTLTLSDGRSARIADNFIDKDGNPKNVSWKPCGVKRFELAVK